MDTDNSSNVWQAVMRGAVLGIALGAAFVAGYVVNEGLGQRQQPTSYALLQEAEQLLDAHYLRDLPATEDRIHGAVGGMVSAVEDPYTVFVEPRNAEVDEGNLAGRFGGIGAVITLDETGQFVITRVYPDNPAAEAGVRSGDILRAVDGQSIESLGAEMNAVLAAIRGDVGDPLTLTVERDGEIRDYEMVRVEVLVPAVFWEMTDNPSVGYIHITRFTDRSPDEVVEAIADLKAQGAQALVIDLRGNGGGLVDAAVGILDEFVTGGVVLIEERKGMQPEEFTVSRRGTALELPLVVLVNGGTASSSEIVAGALRDRGRAVLVGQQTFGKGSVQLIFELSDGSSLHVTNAEWLTPDGNRIEGAGLVPDVLVEPVEGIDAELQAALDYLNETLQVADTSE
ncbi:MAG: S41 family peptidase [Chloroflexi bacterium]|nr:S41 family peptidase [Chloroflexota bacterium]